MNVTKKENKRLSIDYIGELGLLKYWNRIPV